MVPEFFENKEIFITGASGVVGKALIEKLLRSCNVGKIYILLRQKNNFTIEQRMEKLKNAVIFRQLKLKKPEELSKKLVCIPGDAALPALGICAEYEKLLQNVSIIFHCAATVRFDEPINTAVKVNVGGTLQMLKFAEKLTNLEVVMHVSTFYSNPYLKRVEEKIYESPVDWRICLRLLEQNDITEEEIDIISRKLIIGFPNTYCFTKNLAESLVNDHRHTLPVAIYRPSVVAFALEEPEPGFVPSLTGANGLFAVGGAGLAKVGYINKDVVLDISPQDITIKSLCFFTVKAANMYKNIKNPIETPVFIMSTYTHNTVSINECAKAIDDNDLWAASPFEKNFLIPGVHFTDNRFVFNFLFMFKQMIPSFLGDIAIALCGREPVLMRAQRRLYTTLEVTKPFAFNTYESAGVTYYDEMLDKLKGTDFNIDVATTANEYHTKFRTLPLVISSIREHLLKEDPKTIPKSKQILLVKIFAYNVIKFLLAFKAYEKLGNYFQQCFNNNILP